MITLSLQRLTPLIRGPRTLVCVNGHLVLVFPDYHVNMAESARAGYYLYRQIGVEWHQGGCAGCGAGPIRRRRRDILRSLAERELLEAACAVHRVGGDVAAWAVLAKEADTLSLAEFNGEAFDHSMSVNKERG